MAVVLLMIVPLPTMLLDLLLSIDIGLAVVLLLTAIYVGSRWSSRSSRRCCCCSR